LQGGKAKPHSQRTQQHAYHYGQRQQRSQKGSQKTEEGKAQASSCGPEELGTADKGAVNDVLLGF
jgi:hypothetical protein